MLNNIIIGQRLKEARINKRLTQKEVADTVGIATSTVARYEQGHIERLKLPVVEALARCLNVNPTWILGKNVSKNNNYTAIIEVTDNEKNIIETYRLLAEESKIKINDYISMVYNSQATKKENYLQIVAEQSHGTGIVTIDNNDTDLN